MSRCRSCGAAIRWATTVNGKRIPLYEQPVPDGNLVLSDPTPGSYAPTALHVDPDALLLDDPPRFVSHFATCPHADQHRKDHP